MCDVTETLLLRCLVPHLQRGLNCANPHSHVHSSYVLYLGSSPVGRPVPSGLAHSSSPVTRSSAVLVACPDPLVALREYRPLLALVTAGIINLARPSLKEICTPGRVEVEITWPSRNQLTSGTGEPGRQEWARFSPPFCLIIKQGLAPACLSQSGIPFIDSDSRLSHDRNVKLQAIREAQQFTQSPASSFYGCGVCTEASSFLQALSVISGTKRGRAFIF